MIHNPQADPIGKGQALDVDEAWEPSEEDIAGGKMLAKHQPEYIALAKRMAEEHCEECPHAWYWYVGWAHRLSTTTLLRLRKTKPNITWAEVLEDLGL